MTVNITKPTLGATSGWGTVLNTALDAIVTEVNAQSGTYESSKLTKQPTAGAAQTLDMSTASVFDLTLGGQTFTDGTTTSASATLGSATAGYTSADKGLAVTGIGIASANYVPGDSTISSTSVTLFTNNNRTATGVTFNINRPCALTVANAPATSTATLRVRLRQDGQGSRTVAWFAGIVWPGGRAPELSVVPGAVDDFTFTSTDGGTTWVPLPGTGTLAARGQDVSRLRHGPRVAFLGDSITANGSLTSQYPTKLASAASAGATSIVVDDDPTSLWNGGMIAIGTGATAEYVAVNSASVTGTGPWTLALPNSYALAFAHPAGTPVYGRPSVYQGQSWAARACIQSGQRARFGGMFAKGGYRIEQIRDFYLPQLVANKPDVAVVMQGVNDLITLTPAANVALTCQIWDRLHAAGIAVVALGIPPENAFSASNYLIHQVNTLLADAARERGIPFIDTFGVLVDPSTGGYTATYNADNVHPSEIGAEKLGDALAAFFQNYLPGSTVVTVSTNTLPNPGTGSPIWPCNNTNALFSTTTGSGAAVVPTGWTAGNATGGTFAVATQTGWRGNALTVTRTATQSVTPIAFGPSFAVTPGHVYELTFRILTSGVSAAYAASQSNAGGNTSSTFSGFHVYLPDANGVGFYGPGLYQQKRDLSGVYHQRFVVPGGMSINSLSPRIVLNGDGSTSPAYSVSVGELTVKDLTAAGVTTVPYLI